MGSVEEAVEIDGGVEVKKWGEGFGCWWLVAIYYVIYLKALVVRGIWLSPLALFWFS